jgi:membrane protease subunit HflK
MHWWVGTMALLYAVSGVTIVKPDEVAVILRWGHLVGETPALQQHGPGLLFALPRPVDNVVRVTVKHVQEVQVSALASLPGIFGGETLDPVTQGYALTGDQNIVHVDMVARYQVRDPVQWAFSGPRPQDMRQVLTAEVTAAMVRSLGEMGVDRVLSEGRKALIALVKRRAQTGLDEAHSGLELASLELIGLAPPAALTNDFNAVQSAFIGAETLRKEAQAFAQSSIPQAQASVDATVQAARASAAGDFARAQGDAEAFLALDREFRANPVVVRERLYRDAVERAIGGAMLVRWVPPPTGGRYQGFRISLMSTPAGEPTRKSERTRLSNGVEFQLKPKPPAADGDGGNE